MSETNCPELKNKLKQQVYVFGYNDNLSVANQGTFHLVDAYNGIKEIIDKTFIDASNKVKPNYIVDNLYVSILFPGKIDDSSYMRNLFPDNIHSKQDVVFEMLSNLIKDPLSNGAVDITIKRAPDNSNYCAQFNKKDLVQVWFNEPSYQGPFKDYKAKSIVTNLSEVLAK